MFIYLYNIYILLQYIIIWSGYATHRRSNSTMILWVGTQLYRKNASFRSPGGHPLQPARTINRRPAVCIILLPGHVSAGIGKKKNNNKYLLNKTIYYKAFIDRLLRRETSGFHHTRRFLFVLPSSLRSHTYKARLPWPILFAFKAR